MKLKKLIAASAATLSVAFAASAMAEYHDGETQELDPDKL